MASGPQHYTAAEDALAKAKDIPTEALEFERWIQIASIHAQLAQVAATVDTAAAGFYGGSVNAEAWRNATDKERA